MTILRSGPPAGAVRQSAVGIGSATAWGKAGNRLPSRLAAWLVCALSVAVFLGVKLVWDPTHFSDISIYRAEAGALLDGTDLYGPLPGVHGLATYPPFAAVMFLPLLLVPSGATGTLSLFVNVGLIGYASYLSLRRLAVPLDLHVGVPLLVAAALWCEPVMLNNNFGQINLVILCLVLWDFSLPEKSRWRGVGIGLAAAMKVTPGIFIVYLLVTKRWRAAQGAVLILLATLLVSVLLVPSSTWDYWRHHVLDPTRVGRLENSVNQSARGWIVRASHSVDTGVVAAVVTLLVLVTGMALAAYCYRRRGDGCGVLVAALTGLLASPISWSHHWVWCVPLVAFAWHEARALLVPTLLVFWSYAVWLVPHGDAVELRLERAEIAMSGWYVVYAVAFMAYVARAARRCKNPDPHERGSGFSHRVSGRADRI